MSKNNFEPQKHREIDFDSLIVKEAIEGRRESAEGILIEIAGAKSIHDLSPIISDYLLGCIRNWSASGFDENAASTAFRIKRENHRPDEWSSIKQKHIYALRVYYLMMGRGKGRDTAIQISAESTHLSESSIKKLIAKSSKGLSVEQAAALFLIENPAVRNRCINPPRKKYQRSR